MSWYCISYYYFGITPGCWLVDTSGGHLYGIYKDFYKGRSIVKLTTNPLQSPEMLMALISFFTLS